MMLSRSLLSYQTKSRTMSKTRSAQIWTSYDSKRVPPLTDESHVRFVIISDTHSTQPRDIPDGDVLLHSGDLTKLGAATEVKEQLDWLVSLPHRIKVLIAGNHDFSLDDSAPRKWYTNKGQALHTQLGYAVPSSSEASSQLKDAQRRSTAYGSSMIYLCNEGSSFHVDRAGVQHKEWKVWGTPWTPEFGGWAWNYTREQGACKVHEGIPKDIDVLLTHGPPYGLGDLDKIHDGSHVGCEELTRKFNEGEIRPVIWACGHIHEARGVHVEKHHESHTDTGSTWPETVLVNSSIVEMDWEQFKRDRKFSYTVVNQPIIVDVPVDSPEGSTRSSRV